MSISAVLLYVAIFIAKLIEVSLSTLRNVLINRGQKTLGAFIGFFEVLIWIFVVSTVLQNVTEDLIKVVVYCLAFSVGNYVGASIEEKLAIGMSVIEVLVFKQESEQFATVLRENGYGVTTINSSGKENEMTIVKIYLKRKQIPHAINIIHAQAPNALITVGDVRSVKGGYIRK